MMAAECQVGGGGDCLIKLFGKTIPVPEAKDLHHSGSSSSSTTESDAAPETAHQQDASADQSPQPEPEVVDAEDPNKSSPKVVDTASLREKLKKPDKVLPCPRCSSMDTKFCYFNNYNVNQPRHFCKNCQRYWTAGGAMRNVPVGAGRRKNKHAIAASHFFQRVRAVLPDATAAGQLKSTTGGTVLSFAPHDHYLAEQQVTFHHLKEKLLVPAGAGNPALEGPCTEAEGSSNNRDHQDTTSSSPHGGGGGIREKSTVENEKAANGSSGVPQAAGMNNNGATTVWPSPAATYFSSGIAIPIYPAAPGYWGCCMVPPGPWSLPWPVQPPPPPQAQAGLVSPTTATPSVSLSSSGPGPAGSLTLGKHHRDDRESDEATKVWAPKTIRIDDADEVARSSIWSLIRTKGGDKKQDEAADHAGGEGQHRLGTVFEPKLEAKKMAMAKQGMAVVTGGSPPPLHGHNNPVALTRSVTFQEGS